MLRGLWAQEKKTGTKRKKAQEKETGTNVLEGPERNWTGARAGSEGARTAEDMEE